MNDRDIPPDETNWPCHVGSGECSKPAVKILDDGHGGDFYVCADHLKDMMAMEQRLINDPSALPKLKAAIDKYE